MSGCEKKQVAGFNFVGFDTFPHFTLIGGNTGHCDTHGIE
jgi:hypothetical protein